MADYQNNYQKPLPKTAFNEFKLRLSADRIDGAQRRPTLAVSVLKNNPRITVRTEVETDNNKGVVNASMDGPMFYAFAQVIRNATELEPGQGFKIENKNHTWANGERSKDPVVVSNTLVGKDEAGRVYIGVVAKNVTPVKFILMPSSYHYLSYKDGSAVSEDKISQMYALGYATMLENLVANVMDTHYMPPEPKPQNGGGGYGGGNRGGGNYGGGQRSGGGSQQKAPASGGDGWDTSNDDFPL